jgi:uncharacterized membrane protein
MRFVTQIFFKGLVVVLPIVAAVYVLLWVVRDGESLVKGTLLLVLPEEYYVPGLGLLTVVAAVFCVGLLMYPWLTRKLLDTFDALLRKVPLFGIVYGPTRDLMDVLGGDMQEGLGQVVLIKVPNTDLETLGFVTRDDLSELPDGLARDDRIVVYVQWSSQIGGYCFLVPRSAVRPVDMTVEEGMRWALTAGISAPARLAGPADQANRETEVDAA